jgi:hypothetical protein
MSKLTYPGYGAGPWTHNDGTVSYTTTAPPAPTGNYTWLGFGGLPWRYTQNFAVGGGGSARIALSSRIALNVTSLPFTSVAFTLSTPLTFDARVSATAIEGDPVDPPMFSGTIPDQAFVRNVEASASFGAYFTNPTSGTYSLPGWPTGFVIDSNGDVSGTPPVGGRTTGCKVRFTSISGEIADSNEFVVVVSAPSTGRTRPWWAPPLYHKDQHETKVIECPWTDLNEDSIVSSTWNSDGLVIDYTYVVSSVAFAVTRGGTAGVQYYLCNQIVTDRGETLERTAYVNVTDQRSNFNDYG